MKKDMKIDRTGCFRMVILTKNWAFKIPNLTYGWYFFLKGLLANMDERHLSKHCPHLQLCPVKFYVLGGFLIVMPKVRLMTDQEFVAFDYNSFKDLLDGLNVENKSNSFGYLDGKVVCIDYGNP